MKRQGIAVLRELRLQNGEVCQKLNDYEVLGISEYWIVDHAALGAVRYIGSPKQPTISIYRLLDDEYQVQKYQGNEQILSQVFPELQLTADQIFRAEL